MASDEQASQASASSEGGQRPWDRLPDETPGAYRAFRMYLALGPYRSLDKVGHQIRAKTGRPAPEGKRGSFGRLEQWSSRYGWVRRADSYDDNHAEMRLEQYRRQLKSEAADATGRMREMREDAWRIAKLLQAKVERAARSDAMDGAALRDQTKALQELTTAMERLGGVLGRSFQGLPSEFTESDQPTDSDQATIRVLIDDLRDRDED